MIFLLVTAYLHLILIKRTPVYLPSYLFLKSFGTIRLEIEENIKNFRLFSKLFKAVINSD